MRLLIALVLLVLAGCGAGNRAAPTAVSAPPAVAPMTHAEPVELQVDAIDVSSRLAPLGLNTDGTVEVPPLDAPMLAGWYRHGPSPGEAGPAVILGHVNGGGEDGVFARLPELGPGDPVDVVRADGTTAVFTVTRAAQVPKSRFPTDAVYGDTAGPELRLITCGGELDTARRSYRDNIIVFAVLTGTRAA